MAIKNDKEIIKLKCSRCGRPIEIKYGTYRRSVNDPHYCSACRGQIEHERISSLNEKERNEYLQKKNSAISKGWNNQTQQMKDHVSDMRKANWINNNERKNNHSIRLAKQWNDKSQEEKDIQIEKLNAGKMKYWNNLENKEYHSKRAREKWYNQPQEERDRILLALDNGRKYFLENLTDDQKKEIFKKKSTSLKKYWASLSEEEYGKRMDEFRKALKNNFDNLNMIPNKNESTFINYLNIYKLRYEFVWYNKNKHPEFDKLFPSDKININRSTSPYHAWDFIIHTKDGDVLVDVDGSIHDSNKTNNVVTDYAGNKFILSDYIQFKDSQRPYQTDDLPAYSINCHNDNIDYSTTVTRIDTGENMAFKAFMSLLEWMDMDDKKKRELIASV